MTTYPHLFSPIELGPLRLANRAIMGSMHTNLEETGDWNRVAAFYEARALGEAALIVTGGIAPNAEGSVFPGAAGMATAQDVAHHRIVTSRVHGAGGHIAMQILHTGRYGYGKNIVAPSAIRAPIAPHIPAELDGMGIEKQLSDMALSAALAREAGYDGIELMGSEGYLLNQFVSPRTNHRDDAWGGDAERRRRFPTEAVRRIRRAVGPDFLLIYRISLMDLVPGGASWAETLALAADLREAGADVFNTGIGWHEARVPTIAASVPRRAFTWVTAKFRKAAGVPVIASNRINTPEVAEAVLAEGEADLISMARPFLADEAFMAKARAGQAAQIVPCIACNQACLDRIFSGQTAGCLVNPRAARETELTYAPATTPKRIAVVGAGAAGITAATVAAARGHRVTLFEASAEIGGQLRLAAQVPGKEEFVGLLAWFAQEIDRTGVDLRLNTAPTPETLAPFDEIVLATGVTPRDPGIETTEDAHVATYAELLSGAVAPRPRVAVIGAGGIGFDVAEYLVHRGPSAETDRAAWMEAWGVADPEAHPGGLHAGGAQPGVPARQVTLLQRKAERPGKGLGRTTGWIHRASLAGKAVKMRSGVTYRRITGEGLEIIVDGVPELVPADTIVLCTGQEPARVLADQLHRVNTPVHIIGGASRAAELDAERAIREGAELAAGF